MRYSYLERSRKAHNLQSRRLFELMEKKKTNLGVALDVACSEELLSLANLLGPEVCLIKTHIDLLQDFKPSVVRELKKLSEEHNFLIFEDRKFADIGTIAARQYAEGLYHIVDWADIVTAHIISGPGIIEALRRIGGPKGKGLLLIAEMSVHENLFTEAHSSKAVRFSLQYSDFVMGFISGRKLSYDDAMVHLTPGVHIANTEDEQDQTYRTPESVIALSLSDIILVGRGIYGSQDPHEKALEYKERGYLAYSQSISKQFII